MTHRKISGEVNEDFDRLKKFDPKQYRSDESRYRRFKDMIGAHVRRAERESDG